MSFRHFRIYALLILFALAVAMTYGERWWVAQWRQPLKVTIYPVNGGDSDAVRTYISALEAVTFQEISIFIGKQGERYRLHKPPEMEIRLGNEIQEKPPVLPVTGNQALQSLWWSLKMRSYSFRHSSFFGGLGSIKIFVVYHEGEDGRPLQHSLGMQKGLTGVVHAFAQSRQNAQNNVIIAHELLHTLGATDKYDSEGLPVYPEGFSEQGDGPHYPQHAAEIMAGRRAVLPDKAVIPGGLDECVVGYKTAYEIGW